MIRARAALSLIGFLTPAIALTGCSPLPADAELGIHSGSSSADQTTAGKYTPEGIPSTHVPLARGDAQTELGTLPVKGRAPKTGYMRSNFGSAWTDNNDTLWGGNSLSTREDILSRDLRDITCKTRPEVPTSPPCVVHSGILEDPYTGDTVNFLRGNRTSVEVPIDHVVSLSDAWQKGAQQLSEGERINLANDPLNLIATTRAPNSAKGDGDAATWLTPDKSFRCSYVARQIAVKARYRLWVTPAESEAMNDVLSKCPGQALPAEVEAAERTV